MTTVLLFIIAAVAPWTVHLAPPRQRAAALVGVVAVLLLFGIFARNPLAAWPFWVGLLVGVVTVVLLSGDLRGRGRRGGGGRRGGDDLEEPGTHATGEFSAPR